MSIYVERREECPKGTKGVRSTDYMTKVNELGRRAEVGTGRAKRLTRAERREEWEKMLEKWRGVSALGLA